MTLTDGTSAHRLEISGASVHFGGVVALDDVSIVVDEGEIVSIIGPNGAGKTTLLNCISGLIPLTNGRISLDGLDLRRVSPQKRTRLGLGRTFQGDVSLAGLTVLETVLLSWDARKALSRRERLEDTNFSIEYLGLAPYRNRLVSELSYGYRKMVDVARALAAKPTMMLYDEPAAGLNSREKQQLAETLVRIKNERRITQIVIEHDMRVIRRVSDRVAVLDFGKVLGTGDPESVLSDPEIMRAYLGPTRTSVEQHSDAAKMDPSE